MVVDTSLPLRDIAEQYKNKNADEMLADLNQIPFFMTEFKEGDEENPQIEALRALAYDGEPDEIAENFKAQGNDCFKTKKFKDAIQFYTQALDQKLELYMRNPAPSKSKMNMNRVKNYSFKF